MLFNLIAGIVCGVAGGMNLAVGNGIVGLVNIILSFGNFFLWSYLRKKENEAMMVYQYQLNMARLGKEVKTDERKDQYDFKNIFM